MAKTQKVKQESKAAPVPGGPKRVNVHHLTRVEGHGNIVAEIDESGKVTSCRWEVPEAPRFFEAMVLGKSFEDIHHITSRICGICSIGHQLASLQATEDALGVQVSEQTLILRKLALHAENLQSHLLHIGYLALPDFVGAPSVIPLAATHRKELLTLIGARRVANDFSAQICGRTTHPQRFVPGGMAKVPTAPELAKLRQSLEETRPKLDAVVDLLAAVLDKVPAFARPTEYVALISPTEYALYWGQVGSSKAQPRPAQLYLNVTKEYLIPTSTAKWCRGAEDTYMVGALARFNVNSQMLSPRAKEAARKLKLKAPCHNPYMITIAQMVECVHSVDDSISLIDKLLTRGVRDEPRPQIKPVAGKGVGAVEVPRGILFHAYEYDDRGRVVHADCVIPTNQNHANIQRDMEALTPGLAKLSEADIELKLSMLVRAYDPCISCSTHLIDVAGERPGPFVTFVRV
ncbi:MAG: Ni/Fe hydrogenase subunit alpha [Desulfovibrio sp.]|nr:Ni/Fe hydrogenase subunit alpha [Desulfovibrio sp.]MBI4960079.1 Ni/Fe hydrogenase subunit alpha [Desulfovibrio sp.]